MGLSQQFFALLWKNWKIKYRSWGSILAELIFPLLLSILIFYTHYDQTVDHTERTVTFDPLWSNYPQEPIFVGTPSSSAIETLVRSQMTGKYSAVHMFPTVEQATEFSRTLRWPNISTPVVSFELDDVTTVPHHLKFKLNVAFNYYPNEIYGEALWLNLYSVPETMHGVTMMFINHWQTQKGGPPSHLRLELVEMPKLVTKQSNSSLVHLSMTYGLLFMALFCFTTITIVDERESKIKESMKLMGLGELIYWMSWFVMNFIYGLYICILGWVVMCVDYSPVGRLLKSSSLLFAIFELVFTVNTISAAFLLGTFFKRGRLAGIISIIVYFAIPMATSSLIEQKTARILLYGVGVFLYRFGFEVARQVLYDNENAERPIYLSTLAVNELDPNKNVLDGLTIMILNTAFNVFFVWYISNIFPGEFGIPKPFNFLFTRSYWVPTAVEEKELPDIPPEEEKYFETPNSDWKAGIQVRNLIKMFGKNVAVAGTNMDVYEGQITVLLGHNGAGKTTTINMITGFLPPTSGTITVHGLDMRKNTDAARKSIGFCPQHDILFAKLTCKEHLIFFLKIKGKYKKELMPAIIERLNSVGLGGKINDYSSQLSGGQKRKLSLACAFSGDTQVVFLDEPSTGLDPAARQEMWAFLKTMREGRTILLTTHYMDEADVLGDRIAIMAEGRVKCCGTPMFLKRVYGAGYRLKIVKQPGCNTDAVTQQINQILPQAKFMSETNSEIDYLLPEIVTEKFPQLLKILEDDTRRLQINGFGLTATSMEDVFVKVGEGVTAEDIAAAVEEEVPLAANEVHNVEKTSKIDSGTIVIDMAASDPRSSNVDLSQNNTKPRDETVVSQSQQQTDKIFKMFHVCKSGSKLGVFGQQLRGIVIKKWVLFRRNLISSLVLIALPSIILGMGIYSDKSKTETSMEPMVFSAEHLTNVITPIESNEQTNQELVKEFKKQLPSSEFPVHDTVILHVHDTVILHVHDTLDPNEYFLRWLKANGKEKYDKMVLGVVFEQHDFVHLYFNGRIRHAPGIAVQLMLNAEVKRVLGEEFSVQSGLRYFSSDLANEESLKTFMALNFAMALVPVVFIYSLIVERATGAKHLQTLSGVHPIAYWLGTFVIDFLVMLLLIVLTLCLLTLNPKTFIDNDRWLVLLIGFLCFGCTTFPFLYLVQNIFSSPSRGIVVLLIANVVIGVVIGLIIGMLKMMGVTLTGMYFYLDLAFGYISPSYSLSVILTTVLGVNSKIAKNFTEMMDYNNQILPEVFYKFLGQAAVSWILILFIEYKLHRFLWYNIPCLGSLICKGKSVETVAKEDDDVSNERKRVHGSKKEDLVNKDALLLIDLKKVYCGLFGSTKTAVHPVSFGVPDKECLGLLGQNGAGKTTIFKMLTGDITLSTGEAYVGGYNIKSHLKKVQSMMSYCPQFDALHDVLTGRETLYLYGRLRGVREHCLHEITEIIIDFITLRPHEDKITSAYSGGNKRKLSIGIAIIGDPHFIMLDEPTAGMDPISRRSLWKCLHMIRSMERTLVLTSHSMEECEALCTKIAILKRGRLMCLGSTQHLKNKFAQGYTVILHAKHQEDGSILPLKPSVDFLISSIPGTTVFNAQPSYYHLQVPETARLSEIFRLSLEARSTFDLQHFTVQQTSLEQVFLLLMKDEK